VDVIISMWFFCQGALLIVFDIAPIVTDPFLATSVENHIAIYKVSWTDAAQSSEDSSLGLVVTQESHWTLDDDVASLHWINQTVCKPAFLQ
jgi:hypothetical protein